MIEAKDYLIELSAKLPKDKHYYFCNHLRPDYQETKASRLAALGVMVDPEFVSNDNIYIGDLILCEVDFASYRDIRIERSILKIKKILELNKVSLSHEIKAIEMSIIELVVDADIYDDIIGSIGKTQIGHFLIKKGDKHGS